jgi:hypothetical protein
LEAHCGLMAEDPIGSIASPSRPKPPQNQIRATGHVGRGRLREESRATLGLVGSSPGFARVYVGRTGCYGAVAVNEVLQLKLSDGHVNVAGPFVRLLLSPVE